MKDINKNIFASIIVGFLFVLPFAIMEWVTSPDHAVSNFPISLFAGMWLFATIFAYMLISIVRIIRAGKANPVFLALRFVVLICMAWALTSLIVDQMPCFLGATGC